MPDPSNNSEGGSGTTAVRMLSTWNAGAVAESKVISARSNGNVLSIPANPPLFWGSGAAPYERDPTGTAPLKREIVVALGTTAPFMISNPYPNEAMRDGNINVKMPLAGPEIFEIAAPEMLLVGGKGPVTISLSSPKLQENVIPSTIKPLTSDPFGTPVKVVSVEPRPNAPLPIGMGVAEACEAPAAMTIATASTRRRVIMVSSLSPSADFSLVTKSSRPAIIREFRFDATRIDDILRRPEPTVKIA